MELVKDIYFNTDKLVENEAVKLSYTGKFYQGNNDKVYLHYGFGKDWNNVNDIEMEKTDLGYQAEFVIAGSDCLNFCFKNQNNEWDNNYGNNYVFDIEKPDDNNYKDNYGNKNFDNKYDNNWNNNNEQKTLVYCGKNFGNSDAENLNNVETIQCNEIPQSEVSEAVQTEQFQPVPQEQAIALAPTGFIYWTQKVREAVSRFFSYVPKLISGNYRRNVNNNGDNK